MDILEMLQAKSGFTSTEMKIAEYVLGHCHQVSGMSANALAKETFSSNASVIRMCRKMGLSGYREFQIALAVRLSKSDKRNSVSRETAPTAVMKLFGETIIKAVENCLERVSRESLVRASALMSRANRLHIYGVGACNALAFSQMMSDLGIAATVPNAWKESPGGKETGLERDVAVFIAHSGDEIRGFAKEMASLRKRGCQVIAISTESACSEADIVIRFPQAEINCPYAETAYLQAAFLYITTCMNYMIGAAKDAQ